MASGAYFLYHPIAPIIPIKIELIYDVTMEYMPSFYNSVFFIPVYGIGMILGYFLLQQEGKQKPLSFLWLIGYYGLLNVALVIIASVYWTGEFFFGPTAEVFYVAFVKTLFSSCFALLFYALFNCDSQILMSLARSRVSCMISRLTLAWFFTHPIHIMFRIASQDQINLSAPIIIMDFAFIFITSFFSACVLHLFVEAPVTRLISASMKRGSKVSSKADDDIRKEE